MKDKILFLIDHGLIHYGIANSMQKLYDADFYAIVDVGEKIKNFFLNQKDIKFEKIWFYLDHMSKSKNTPDLMYLKSFEEKYQISLWNIAFSDKYFLHEYNELYKFHHDEILSILEKECKFFEKVLEQTKPNFLILNLTNMHHNQLLYELCKAKKIKVLMMGPLKFGHRKMISENAFILDSIEKNQIENNKKRNLEELKNYQNRFDTYKQNSDYIDSGFKSEPFKRYKGILDFFLESRNNDYTNHFEHYGRTKTRVFLNKISRSVKRKYRENYINKKFMREIIDSRFIYFPLQFEPERMGLMTTPFYRHQIAVITNIAKSIPIDYLLYVKEHFAMRILGWRSISYYKQLSALPNVRLIHPSLKPKEILKKCSLVIATSGTACLEAAFYEKPSIVFSDLGLSSISSIKRIRSMEDLPETIRIQLQKKVNVDELNNHVQTIDNNSFEANVMSMGVDFSNKFGLKGPLLDKELLPSEVSLFFKKHSDLFDKIAKEHVKKIYKHKNPTQTS